MKKSHFAIMATTFTLALSGCAPSQTVQDGVLLEDSAQTESSVPQDNAGLSADSTSYIRDATRGLKRDVIINTCCQNYLAGRDPSECEYRYYDDLAVDGWIIIDHEDDDCSFYVTIAPASICSSSTQWGDPQAILRSYVDGTEPWADGLSSMLEACLWSPTYDHCWAIKAGWLELDDVRVQPIDWRTDDFWPETYDLSPEALLAAYQSGEWDGETPRYSADYGSRATLSQCGIIYRYEAWMYSQQRDYLGLAYREYANHPCFADYPSVTEMYNDAGDFLDMCYVASSAGIQMYPDLPNVISDRLVYAEPNYSGSGTFALTANRAYLCKQGKILQSWPSVGASTPEDYVVPIGDQEAVGYAVIGDQVLALLPDGYTKVPMTDVQGSFWTHEATFWAVSLSDDGDFSVGCLLADDAGFQTKKLAEDVVAWAGDNPFFIQKADGQTYAVSTSSDHPFGSWTISSMVSGKLSVETALLGTKTPDEYAAEWHSGTLDLQQYSFSPVVLQSKPKKTGINTNAEEESRIKIEDLPGLEVFVPPLNQDTATPTNSQPGQDDGVNQGERSIVPEARHNVRTNSDSTTGGEFGS